ncbi:hypothetical protein [Paraburkholderia sp. J67]|uniref:hypothetical protein n=1 Tax=Paraburkholderia sp. J67 TaxID=2805435 RepID=UPI002ABDA5B2|nr:hypothetical protein [Paraburkholderia sp. J67]
MTYSSNDFSEDIVRCLVDTHGVNDANIHNPDIGLQADAAIAAITAAAAAARIARFIATVIESQRSLDALAKTRGAQVFADTLYLADAIATGCTLEIPPEHASFVGFFERLPRGREWTSHLRVRPV